MKIFIYVLTEPDGTTIRYVGKSNEFRIAKRLMEHCRYSQLHLHTHKNNWIKSLLSQGQRPVLRIIEECQEETYRVREKHWVQYYKAQGCDLTNGTEGGEGAVRICNRVVSDAQKKTISRTLKQKFQENPEMYLQASKAGKKSRGVKRNFGFQQTSKEIGVSFIKSKNRWRCYVWENGKQRHIGVFLTEQEAVAARSKYETENPASRAGL